ncbi:MAG: hypothetical protein ACXIUM_10005 [Wenzhouxiangella sp.]
MPLLHSKPEAALLEAAALSHRLAERYRLAAERLAEHQSAAAGELAPLFTDCADALSAQAEQLDDAARALDLLPREPETELETLKQLADQIQPLLEDDQEGALNARFREEEQALLRELQEAAELNPCPSAVGTGIESGRKRLNRVGGGD